MRNKILGNFSDGQSIAEYVIIIALVSAALVAMQTYMRRGIQGAIQIAADQIGTQQDALEDAATGANTNSISIGSSSGTTRMRTLLGGSVIIDTNETAGDNARWITQRQEN